MFNINKTLVPDMGMVHYLVDSNYRTVAQGWSRADGTGPLDLYNAKNPGYVFHGAGGPIATAYATDSAAVQAANDALVDFRGDTIYFTPGNYSLGTAIAVDVPAARWLGRAYKSPKYGCSPAVGNTMLTATVADVFADGATGSMDYMEVGYLGFTPLTAASMWNLSVAQASLYFHDFQWNAVGVTTDAGTQFMISAGVQTRQLFDNFSWYTDAPQGPIYEMDGSATNIVFSNFMHQHYDTGGTYAISLLDVDGTTVDAISIVGGRGIATVGGGATAVTNLVTLAAQTATTEVLSVFDFRGTIGYATASTLVAAAGDAGEVGINECFISVIGGGAGGQGTAYTA